MGRNCITVLWACLTVFFTVAIVFAMISPVWFESVTLSRKTEQNEISTTVANNYELVSFGIIRYCSRYDLPDIMRNCRFFGSFKEMPSIAWMISTVIYALGLVCFAISVALAAVIFCTSEELAERLKIVSAYVQAVGGKSLSLVVKISWVVTSNSTMLKI